MKRPLLAVVLAVMVACGSFGGDSPSGTVPPAGDAGSGGDGASADARGDDDDGGQVSRAPVILTDKAELAYGLAVDATGIYVGTRNAKGPSVYRVPLEGGEPVAVLSNHVDCTQVVLADDEVYAACVDGIYASKKATGVERRVSSNTTSGIAVTADAVIACKYDKNVGQAVVHLGKDGNSAFDEASDIRSCESIAIAQSDVYFNGNFIGRIAGSGEHDVLTSYAARRIVVDSQFIYSIRYDNPAVSRVRRDGTLGEAWVTPDTENTESGDLAQDDTHVYWEVGRDSGGKLLRADKTTAEVEVLADNLQAPSGVAVFGDYVYWTEQFANTVKRRRK